MARKCRLKTCRAELPKKKDCTDQIQAGGFCGMACLSEHGREKAQEARERKTKEYVRQGRDRLKTRSDRMREAQKAFNEFIRERDHGLPCISCDTETPGGDPRGGLWDCSHYRSVGACPELRFEELNAHRACKNCNRDKSGNIVEYRVRLAKRIGHEALDWLEGPHEAKKYTTDELKELTSEYRRKARDLKKSRKSQYNS